MLRFVALVALANGVKVAVKPVTHNLMESSTEEMLKEALAGRGIEWQMEEMEVDNDLVELLNDGPNMTRARAEAQLTHMENGPLILAEMHEIEMGKVSKADTKGADLFLKLMKSSLEKKQDARMRLNHEHRTAVEGFVKRLTKLVAEIDATSKALTKTLAKRSEAWVKLKKNERLQKGERLKFQEQQRYHRYAMYQMNKDKESLERTQRLLGEGYNKTCPNGFFMLLQKCGQQNHINSPELIQAMAGMSKSLRVHVQSDIAKRLGVPVQELMAKVDDEVEDDEKEMEKERVMNEQTFAHTMRRLEDERDFDTDDILAEEAASVEEGENAPVDVQLVEHNTLMSDVEQQLEQDASDVSLLQRAEPETDVIYPNCTSPKCDVLKPVVKEIDDDLQNSIDSMIRQISAKQKRWASRCAQNKNLNEQYSTAIQLNTERHQTASMDFAKYNKAKIDYLKRLKKLYNEMDNEQRSWTSRMGMNKDDMCAIIMFRDSAVTALKKPKIIDCLMTKWKRSSSCTKECGGGVSQYTRRVLLNASNEGVDCPMKCNNASWDGKSISSCTQTEVLVQKNIVCNTFICPTDCQMNPWSSFGKCNPLTAKGRKGSQTRTRSIGINEANKGLACGVLQDSKSCFMVGGKYANCKARRWLKAGKIAGDRQKFSTPGGPVLLKGLWQINYDSGVRAGCKRKPTEPKPIYKNLTKMKCTMGKYDGCTPLLEKEKMEALSWNHDATHWIQAANGQTLNNMPKMVEQLKNPAADTDYVIGCNSKGKIDGPKSGHFKFISGFEVNVNNNSFTQMEVGCSKPEKMTAGMGKCYRGPVFSLVGDQSTGWIAQWGWCKSSYYLTNMYALATEKDKAFLTAVRHVQCCQRGWPGGAAR